jgi:DNA-binding CsgD family transcriptional regulator
MLSVKDYLWCVDISKNVLKKLVHKNKYSTFLDIDEIPYQVGGDAFEFFLDREVSKSEVLKYCKYRTLQVFTLDRKHKTTSFFYLTDDLLISDCVLKTGNYSKPDTLKKRELVKKLTLEGKTNSEIKKLLNMPSSTICYLQKITGVNFNKEIKEVKMQSEIIKELEKTNDSMRKIALRLGIDYRTVKRVKDRIKEGII